MKYVILKSRCFENHRLGLLIWLADTLFSKTVPKREGVNFTTHKKRKVTLEDFKDEDNPQSLSAWNQQLLRVPMFQVHRKG